MAKFGVFQVNTPTRFLHANHDTGDTLLSGRVVPEDAETAASLLHHAQSGVLVPLAEGADPAAERKPVVEVLEAPDPPEDVPPAEPIPVERSLPGSAPSTGWASTPSSPASTATEED